VELRGGEVGGERESFHMFLTCHTSQKERHRTYHRSRKFFNSIVPVRVMDLCIFTDGRKVRPFASPNSTGIVLLLSESELI
jgi:hypothetical protein